MQYIQFVCLVTDWLHRSRHVQSVLQLLPELQLEQHEALYLHNTFLPGPAIWSKSHVFTHATLQNTSHTYSQQPGFIDSHFLSFFFNQQSNVFMYYGLSNFYQNHRRYVKSRDDSQLNGDMESLKVFQQGVSITHDWEDRVPLKMHYFTAKLHENTRCQLQ